MKSKPFRLRLFYKNITEIPIYCEACHDSYEGNFINTKHIEKVRKYILIPVKLTGMFHNLVSRFKSLEKSAGALVSPDKLKQNPAVAVYATSGDCLRPRGARRRS